MTDTVNPFGVRRAVPVDQASLLDFVLPMLSEESLQPVSPSRVLGMVKRATQQDGAIAGIIDGADGIEASIGLLVDRYAYTEQEHVRVTWAFVHPEYRKSEHAQNLMAFAKWACEQLGATRGYNVPLIYELLTRTDLVGKMKLVQRSLPQVGATFAWGCLPVNQLDQLMLSTGREKHYGRGQSFSREFAPSALLRRA